MDASSGGTGGVVDVLGRDETMDGLDAGVDAPDAALGEGLLHLLAVVVPVEDDPPALLEDLARGPRASRRRPWRPRAMRTWPLQKKHLCALCGSAGKIKKPVFQKLKSASLIPRN